MPIQLTLIYGISALFSFIMGHIVFLEDTKSRMSRAFYAFTMVQFLWIATLYTGYFFVFKANPNPDISVVFIKLAYGFGILMFPLISIFFHYFPRITFEPNKLLKSVFLTGTAAVFLVPAFSDLVHKAQIIVDGIYIADEFGPLYWHYIIFLLIFLFSAAAVAAQKSVVLKGIQKQKVLFSAIGCWVFLFFAASTNVFLPLVGIYQIGPFHLIQNSPLYTLFFIIPTFYAMHRYRFFNYSNISLNLLRNLIIYSVFIATAIFSYSLLDDFISQGVTRGFVSALIALFIFKFSESKIPQLVTSQFKLFKNEIAELKGKLYYCNKYKELEKLLEETFLIKLNFVSAKIYVVRKTEKGLKIPVYKEGTFTKNLVKHSKDGLLKEEITFKKLDKKSKKSFLSAMEKLEIDLCIPLFSENNLIGFLALKQKTGNKVYSKEIMDELLLMKKGLEITLMNILLKLNLEEENNLMKAIIEKKTRELKKKIKEINELLKQQADFIAVTAHEFRTPLSIATFQVDDILTSKKPATQRLKDLKLVETSIGNLKTLTEKLFRVQQYDLNKVELHLEKIDVTAFVKQLYKDFTPIMKDKGLKFSLKMKAKKKLKANVDQAQFRQVLHNLLTNASKFTPKGGKIELYFGEEKGQIDIRIDDNGNGIPDDLKKSIFEKFRTKNAGAGIGLGLYLCKKIIELHKGKLWVEDSSMKGASFRIKLKALR